MVCAAATVKMGAQCVSPVGQSQAKPCTVDADCDPAYTCADWEATPYCRTFSGADKTCGGPSDCAGLDASICYANQCRIANCTPTPMHAKDDCPKDLVCCDVSALGNPAVKTACVKPGVLCP
jgi:hypothetical protein